MCNTAMKILLLWLAATVLSIELNIDDRQSILNGTKIVARKLRALYPTGLPWFNPGEFGLLPSPPGKNIGYYWWEAGAVMGAWIDYWAFTGDGQYNAIVTEAMLHQVGPENDYEPPNQTLSMGNDDQAFWGIAALVAAERGFPDPPKDKPQWLALAQAVFNRQAGRWDTLSCNGGLRWQVVVSNKGYDYKNSVSNGLFFQMGGRLARYTGNQTYADLGEKAYNWCKEMGLLSNKYYVYDGAHLPDCTVSSKLQWSYNAGVFLAGAAAMYDYYSALGNTKKATYWQNETVNLLQATDGLFFNRRDGRPNVMRESGCESPAPNFERAPTCNIDQISFKAYLCRFMGYTFQLAPFTRDFIMPRLRASAVAAAKSCTGQPGGDTCGLSWIMGKFDGSKYGIAIGGVGEHLAVMELFQNLLVNSSVDPPRTHTTGTSQGNPGAGGSGSGLNGQSLRQTRPPTTWDRIGAGILTGAMAMGTLVLAWWLIR